MDQSKTAPIARPIRLSLLDGLRRLGRSLLVPVLAIVLALLVGALVMWVSGVDPLLAYRGLWEGAFGTKKAVSETGVWAAPYIFAGLGVAVAFKGGLFNIGAEGQVALGAVAAAWVGYALPKVVGVNLPALIHVPLAILAGCLAGAIWGGIPGWLKARTGAHEVINTIMMNYLALLLTSYLLNGPMKDPSPTNVVARTPAIAASARIPPIFAGYRVHWGLVLAVLLAIAVWWMLYRSTLGFEIRTVGFNMRAARYAGIKVGRILTVSMGLSGLLAGLAGVIEVTALNYRHELAFAIGYGFDSITVALLAKTNPIGVVVAALLFGAMRNGATRMQFLTQVPVDIISVIQALILLFVAAPEIVRFVFRVRAPKEELVLSQGWGG